MGERESGVGGCDRCWPAEAASAWEARRGLVHVMELIDESHLGVRVLACPACAQRFLSVFEEEVDWVDGDDPQYWTVLPLTEAEATQLLARGAGVTKAELNALGSGRRSLRRDYPKGAAPQTCWGTGVALP